MLSNLNEQVPRRISPPQHSRSEVLISDWLSAQDSQAKALIEKKLHETSLLHAVSVSMLASIAAL